jgi:hypothetical protein
MGEHQDLLQGQPEAEQNSLVSRVECILLSENIVCCIVDSYRIVPMHLLIVELDLCELFFTKVQVIAATKNTSQKMALELWDKKLMK